MSEMSSLYSTHSHLELDVTSWRTLGVSWHGHSNDHYHRSPNSSSVPGCDSNLLNYVCYLTQSLGHFCNGDILTTMPHWQTLGYLAREDSYFRPPMRWGVVCRLKSWTSDLNCPPPFFQPVNTFYKRRVATVFARCLSASVMFLLLYHHIFSIVQINYNFAFPDQWVEVRLTRYTKEKGLC